MTLKEKMKSYSFWVSLASAIVLILKVIGSKFGFSIDATLASDIITSICSVLVITGIIVTPTSKANADLEALNSKTTTTKTSQDPTKTTLKENISILADNLKETANEILYKNNDSNESQTTQSTNETSTQDTTTETVGTKTTTPCEAIKQSVELVIPTTDVIISNENVISTNIDVVQDEVAKNSSQPELATTKPEQSQFEKTETENKIEKIVDDSATADSLKSVLSLQKEKYIGNLDLYYQTLLKEVKSLKPNE